MKKGFTLIELLGIITILGLILIVAIPMLIESNRVASANRDTDDNENIKIAARDYVSSCYELECCTSDLNAQLQSGSNVSVDLEDIKKCGFISDYEGSNRSITVKPDGTVD